MARKNKSIIINGVGTFFAKDKNNNKLMPLGSLQSLRFDFSVTEDPVYGGDGLFPIDYVTREKNVGVTATNAKFDLNVLRIVTGATLSTASGSDAYRWVLNKMATVRKTGTDPNFVYEVDISIDGSVFTLDPAFSVMVAETGEALTEITSGNPASGEFKYDGVNKKLLFNSDLENKMVMYSFKVAATDVAFAEGKKIDLPIPVTVIHQGMFKQKDDTWQGIETEIKLAKASGTFTLDFARATASASTITLNMLDPEDGTCRLWTMKRFETSAPPCV
jgi:hypothetical protein